MQEKKKKKKKTGGGGGGGKLSGVKLSENCLFSHHTIIYKTFQNHDG